MHMCKCMESHKDGKNNEVVYEGYLLFELEVTQQGFKYSQVLVWLVLLVSTTVHLLLPTQLCDLV